MSDDLEMYGSKMLRKVCERVEVFDTELAKFSARLQELMYEFDGVGLAAVQVGKPLRIAAIDIGNSDKKESLVLINPEIVWKSEEKCSDSEGCLSIPDIRANVERYASITVKAVDEKGRPVTYEKITGLFARAVQHEIDHMDGVLFVDKIDPLKKTLLSGKLKKIAKENKAK